MDNLNSSLYISIELRVLGSESSTIKVSCKMARELQNEEWSKLSPKEQFDVISSISVGMDGNPDLGRGGF